MITQHYRRHRHQEFLRFRKLIDAAVPKGLDPQLVPGQLRHGKTPEIHKWLLRHPRFQLRRSGTELEAGIRTWITAWNADPCHSYGSRPPARSSKPSPPTAD